MQPIVARSCHGSPQHPCSLEDALQEPLPFDLSSLRLPLPESSVTDGLLHWPPSDDDPPDMDDFEDWLDNSYSFCVTYLTQ